MAVSLTINGTVFFYPETNDTNWGSEATDWASAVTTGMLQKAGGAFTLLAEVDFGATYGLKSVYYKTQTANLATAGQFRLARTDVISWRNQANSANLDLSVDSSNNIKFNGLDFGITSLTGDVTGAGPGSTLTTISAGAVSLAKMANLAANSIIGNNTGSPATPLALTGSQVTALLSTFVGDSGSGGAKGLVPATVAGDATKFLSGSGIFADIPTELSASYDLKNLGLLTSVAASALTIALKDETGADPSVGSPVRIGFRNSTATSGDYSSVNATAATSVVVSSGSTLGHTSGNPFPIYVYALNNSGTVELAVSTTLFDEGSVQSTTAEGGAGAADSFSVLYSTTARSNVPIRLIGKLMSTQTTAGTWATQPQAAQVSPVKDIPMLSRWYDGGAITVIGVTTNPTKGTVFFDTFWWRRNGDSMDCRLEFKGNAGGAEGVGAYFIQLPSGYNIDLTKMKNLAPYNGASTLGTFVFQGSGGNPDAQGYIWYVDAGGGKVGLSANLFPESGGAMSQWGSGYGGITGSTAFGAYFTVPITEFNF